ncbi:MAG: hypothetical protein KAT00_02355 [Planctomycetes bacterium]|nr:hypothetical protein [Planctomycetota bacterium]
MNMFADSPNASPVRLVLAVLAIACLPGMSSCDDQSPTRSQQDHEISRTWENGSLKVALQVSRTQITVAQRIRMDLEITAPQGYQLQLTPDPKWTESFELIDLPVETISQKGDLVDHRHTYLLEPFIPGEHTLGPVRITAWHTYNPSDRIHIDTEPIDVKVASGLAKDDEAAQIRDIAGPIGPSAAPLKWIYALILLTAAGVIGGYIRKKNLAQPQDIQPTGPRPYEVAWRQLQELLSQGLIEKGQLEPFYTSLSGILRHYIEGRFALAAPAQTTDEFLAGISDSDIFDSDCKEMLAEFLNCSDFVKFAHVVPASDIVDRSIETCRGFIHQTGYIAEEPGDEAVSAEPGGGR